MNERKENVMLRCNMKRKLQFDLFIPRRAGVVMENWTGDLSDKSTLSRTSVNALKGNFVIQLPCRKCEDKKELTGSPLALSASLSLSSMRTAMFLAREKSF